VIYCLARLSAAREVPESNLRCRQTVSVFSFLTKITAIRSLWAQAAHFCSAGATLPSALHGTIINGALCLTNNSLQMTSTSGHKGRDFQLGLRVGGHPGTDRLYLENASEPSHIALRRVDDSTTNIVLVLLLYYYSLYFLPSVVKIPVNKFDSPNSMMT